MKIERAHFKNKCNFKISDLILMRKIYLFFIAFLFVGNVFAGDSIYYRAKIWDKKIQEFILNDKKITPDEGKKILFIGSSSFTRWDNIQKYFPGYNIVNRGFGASVTSDLIYYAEQIIFPYNYSQIVIYEGDNDIGGGMAVNDFIDDIKTLVRMIEIRLPGVPVLILSVKSCPKRDKSRKLYEEANVKLYEFSLTKKHVTFVDVYSSLLDNMGNYKQELFAPDLLHINGKAYDLWAEKIRPYLVK